MAPPTKRPKRNQGPLSTDRILNSSSPILTKDIHAFLVICISGWDTNYNENEKRAIIASLPPLYQIYNTNSAGELLCPIDVEFVLADPFVKAAVGKFIENVGEGYYEKSWQTKARKAMQERRDGDFDGYLAEHTEELFGKGIIDDEDGDENEVLTDSDWEKCNTSTKGGNGGRRSVRRSEDSPKPVEGCAAKAAFAEDGRLGEVSLTTRSGSRSVRSASLYIGEP